MSKGVNVSVLYVSLSDELATCPDSWDRLRFPPPPRDPDCRIGGDRKWMILAQFFLLATPLMSDFKTNMPYLHVTAILIGCGRLHYVMMTRLRDQQQSNAL